MPRQFPESQPQDFIADFVAAAPKSRQQKADGNSAAALSQ